MNHSLPRPRVLALAASALAVGGLLLAAPLPAVAVGAPGPVLAYDVPDYPITPIGPAHDDAKPTVVVIDAGGTLTSRARDRISYQHYSGSVEGGVQTILTDMYPELAPVANIEVVAVGGLGGSSAVRNETLYNVSRTADAQLARDDVDGVVITAGTNVLEEDAYFFDLTVQSPKPVVVTGSMHQYGTFTYDAYTNLFSSVRLAASAETTCYGTVVLLNDQFFAARDVTKTDGYRMDTFESRQYGALGVVNEDVIRPLRAPARVMACGTDEWRTPFDLATIEPTALAQVDIVYGYVEASAATITGPVEAGARGIVTAGHGPGGTSYLQSPAISEAAAAGVVFVSTTRTGGEGTYDSGSGDTIGAGDLLPQKARLLLQLGLSFGGDREQIRSWFATIGDATFSMSGALQPQPGPEPTSVPTDAPTALPTSEPTALPSSEPTAGPGATATTEPSPTASAAASPLSGGGDDGGGGLAFTGLGYSLVGLATAGAVAVAIGLWLRVRRGRRGEAIMHG